MSPSQPVTETLILHLKEGVNLENVATITDTGTGASSSPAVQAFIKLTDTVKLQKGFIRQYLGHQVEDPRIFVWYIDWESSEHIAAFVGSEEHPSFVTGMGHVFDLNRAAPLTIYTRFTSDAHPALAAPVTEIAFYTVPNTALEEAKTLIEASSVENTHPVITVGKSSGGAVGWVFDTRNASDAAPEGQSIALHGVFGYGCVGDHVRWRGTVEHAMVIEDMGRSAMGRLGMGNAVVPGGNLFVRDSSMFHVRFQVG